jgi:hypothetical protein
MRKNQYRELGPENRVQLEVRVQRPLVRLAESIGSYTSPFESFRDMLGGFDDRKFILDRAADGDEEAIAAREDMAHVRRHRRLGEPLHGERNLEKEFLTRHRNEYAAFRRKHYPWIFSHEGSGASWQHPNPRVDEYLDHFVCDRLGSFGFLISGRKSTKAYWRCFSALMQRRMTIYFDKGTYQPSIRMTGEFRVEELGVSVSLADPFFFSGCVFYTSLADQLDLQMERFFAAFGAIFPHFMNAVSDANVAADELLGQKGE